MSNQVRAIPPHFIVIVPGIMGSRLRDPNTGVVRWVDFSSIPLNPLRWKDWLDQTLDALKYPSRLEADGILDEVVFVPPWAKLEEYGRLFQALAAMGYRTDPARYAEGERDVYAFGYDWRQDNRISARQLGAAIQRWQAYHPGAKAWIIAHSMGGMVSRWYIEKEGGKDSCGRLFLMGSPWDGAPKAMDMLFDGFDTLFRRYFDLFDIGRRTRDLVRTFPSAYQLLPYEDPFLRDANNQPVDLYDAMGWLDDDHQRQLLLDGRRFNQELGKTLSVETLCFFGSKKPTTTAGLVRALAQGRWESIIWNQTELGDGTVPEHSAVHPNAREKLPCVAGHGDIYVNAGVLEKLEWELIRKYKAGVLAELATEHLQIVFEPEKDVYSPGEVIDVWATVQQRDDGAPVFDAEIDVQLVWRQALPGSQDTAPQDAVAVQLEASATVAGRYEGRLSAPDTAGYYQLTAGIAVPGEPAVSLEELVLVEEAPVVAAEPTAALEATPRDDTWDTPIRRPAVLGFDEDEETDGSTQPGARRGFDESAKPDSGAAPAGQPAPPRYLNARIADDDMDQPLAPDQSFTLAFLVDVKLTKGTIFDEPRVFGPEEELVDLTVYLLSKDFRVITPEPQHLIVPRTGRSRNSARFDVEPKRAGDGEITALFYKNNNFIEGMTLKINVGVAKQEAIVDVKSLGRPPDGAFALQPRDVSIFIKPATGGFAMTMIDTWSSPDATLSITLPQLDQMIRQVRQVLMDIVYMYVDPSGVVRVYPKPQPPATIPPSIDLVHQSGIDIPEQVSKEALRRLAEAGYLLYQDIFYGPGADADTRLIGDRLREFAEKDTLKIQIISQQFLLPWGVLYVAEELPDDPAKIEPERFLGFKHIIEQIPLQPDMPVIDTNIASQPRLTVSLNIDADIDHQFGVTVIQDQLDYWDKIKRTNKTQIAVRKTDQDLLKALNDTATADQILYFYCHGVSFQLDKPDESSLGLSNKTRVTYKDLRLRAPTKKVLAGAPLVFVNACESAELSPLFYGGFMPYFTTKGARGMIGTECETPVLFAAEWARRFFDAFLAGNVSLGQVFLSLRREFFYTHHNILGLVYALYCDGDTQVVPGLRMT